MRKGISTGLVVVMAMVLALAMGAAVIFGFSPVMSSSEDATNNVSDGVGDSSENAQCVSACRAEHPRGGPDFYGCRESC